MPFWPEAGWCWRRINRDGTPNYKNRGIAGWLCPNILSRLQFLPVGVKCDGLLAAPVGLPVNAIIKVRGPKCKNRFTAGWFPIPAGKPPPRTGRNREGRQINICAGQSGRGGIVGLRTFSAIGVQGQRQKAALSAVRDPGTPKGYLDDPVFIRFTALKGRQIQGFRYGPGNPVFCPVPVYQTVSQKAVAWLRLRLGNGKRQAGGGCPGCGVL